MAEQNSYNEVIKRTQEKLGKFVKKPQLTDKLLQKPPFRFLFDVFNVVIKDTGCFAGLYTPQELNYENIKDRDDKMRFLQKMIDAVKNTTGAPLTVRTSKIVSGHEPEKTNELLIMLGEVIEQKLDWQSAVQQVINDGQDTNQKTIEKSKNTNKIKEKGKVREKPKEKERRSSNDAKEIKANSTKVNNKEAKIKRDEKLGKEKLHKEKEKTRRESKETIDKNSKKSNEKLDTKKTLKATKSINQSSDLSATQDNSSSKLEKVSHKIQESVQKTRKSSASKQEKLVDNMLVKEADSRKSSSQSRSSESAQRHVVREESLPNELTSQESLNMSLEVQNSNTQSNVEAAPTGAATVLNAETKDISSPKRTNTPVKIAPAPLLNKKPAEEQTAVKRESTFTRDNSLEAVRPRTSLRPPSARPASARPGAPRRRDKNIEIILQPNEPVTMSGINVKLDAFKDLDDDGEHLVVIEDPLNTDSLLAAKEQSESSELNAQELEQQGHLVQQILETQKELVQKTEENAKEKFNDRLSSASVRQSSARQVNGLRDIIQNLTKAVNPLGKLMDFVPEDIDGMQLELSMWRDAYIQAAQDLKRERSLTAESTEPLKHQLTQIEENIKEYKEMVDSSRVKMLQNSEKILKLLTD